MKRSSTDDVKAFQALTAVQELSPSLLFTHQNKPSIVRCKTGYHQSIRKPCLQSERSEGGREMRFISESLAGKLSAAPHKPGNHTSFLELQLNFSNAVLPSASI